MEWAKVLQAVEDDPRSTSLDERTTQNLKALIKYGRDHLLPPSTAGQGYYRSAVLDWTVQKQQVEVFKDRFEMYYFSTIPAAIRHVEIEVIDQLPDSLIPLLKQLKR